MQRLGLALVVATAALATAPAFAHPAPFTYVDLRLGAGAIDATLVAHVFDLAHDLNIDSPDRLLNPDVAAGHADAIAALLQPRLRIEGDGRILAAEPWSAPEVLIDRQSLRLHRRYRLHAPAGSIAVSTLMFAYDPNHQTFVNVYEDGALSTQAILDRDHTRLGYFTGTVRGRLAALCQLAPAGMRQMFTGPEHLVFLAGLLLLGGSLRRLVAIVAAFSAASGATLALAALGIVSPPAQMIQPAMALGIIYVGIDNLLMGGGRDMRAYVALVFGLIHGVGFANAFRALELPGRGRGWALLSFAFGVEVGQLLAVTAAALALGALRARSAAAGRRLALAGSIVAIAAGAFWFIQRAFFPLAIH